MFADSLTVTDNRPSQLICFSNIRRFYASVKRRIKGSREKLMEAPRFRPRTSRGWSVGESLTQQFRLEGVLE